MKSFFFTSIVVMIIYISFIKGSCKSAAEEESKLGIPQHYDKQFKINLSVVNRDVEDFLRKGRLAGMENNSFLKILRFYL